MIEFSISLIEFILATFIPIYLGLACVVFVQRKTKLDIHYLSAFALGLMFWFFLDTLNDGVQLEVNEGYSFTAEHVVLLAVFILGFLVIALPSGQLIWRKMADTDASRSIFAASILVAIGMGFHGIGEGLQFGGLAAGTQALTVLDAIGGYGGGIAYVTHKLLEAIIVITASLGMQIIENKPFKDLFAKLAALGLAFGIPSALAEAIGYFIEVNSSYLFALGGGAALSVVFFLVRPLFAVERSQGLNYSQWVRMVIATLIGFLCLYGAALFHSG